MNSSPVAAGHFLQLELIEYRSGDGAVHKWEAVQRKGSNVAALIVATLKPSGRILLIRQFRPPLGRYALELPAGLVDPGEDVRTAAIRELKEETGYVGTPEWETGPCASSAGLTGELVSTVFMSVQEDSAENALHVQHLQDNEEIEVMRVSMEELSKVFAEALSCGDVLDSRLAAWAAGLGIRW